MTFLLDANVPIDARRLYYPMSRVPEFWEWLQSEAEAGRVKMPRETWEEISEGDDDLGDWACDPAVKTALLLDVEVDVGLLRRVVNEGYAPDLSDTEQPKLGKDPFLIAHALSAPGEFVVVTTEVSRPSAQRANRHVPDVCRALGIEAIDTFEMIRRLDFSTRWRSR